MLKRTLVFMHPAALSMKDAQLVIKRREELDGITTVPIEDIGVIIVDNPMVTLTIPLLNSLSEQNVAVIFCNQKGMPTSMLQNLDTNSTQGLTLRNQLSVPEPLKKRLWKQIVEAKIRNQSALLNHYDRDGNMLKPFYMNVKSGDADNREGAAARIYWTRLFGPHFVRDRNQDGVNVLLNYGYTILRGAVARAIAGTGLFPAIGLYHRGRSNAFPLADDMMEPYRAFVDDIVFQLSLKGCDILNKDTKVELLKVLTFDTLFGKIRRPLMIGLSMTMSSLAKCYAKETDKLVLPKIFYDRVSS